VTCRPVVFEPLEWLYVMRLATRLLPELSFHRDEEAAGVAAGLGGVSIDTLRDFDWSNPVVYMPPFERLPAAPWSWRWRATRQGSWSGAT